MIRRQPHIRARRGRLLCCRPRLPDWSRFDVQISLQNIRSLDPSAVTRELRKLRLRWPHAKEPKMQRRL
eukprot:9477178-Pyramimonas_sp.AAC.1